MTSLKHPWIRSVAWRLGRGVYMRARGEESSGSILANGEADLQRSVLLALASERPIRVFDIGANEGEWTACLFKTATTHGLAPDNIEATAFEPIPQTRERLSRNLNALGLIPGVTIEPIAVSEEPGMARMAVMTETGGTNSLEVDSDMERLAIGFADVKLTTLTEYCSEHSIGHIHFVKCDTEGHDFLVLQGARQLLEAGAIDVLQFEYNHRWLTPRRALKDVFALVEELPYQLVRICPGYVELLQAWHPELDRFFQCNYALVHNRALPWLDIQMGRIGFHNVWEQER